MPKSTWKDTEYGSGAGRRIMDKCPPLRPAPTVRHAEVDGCRVLLDLNSGSYRVFDPVGSAMWSALAGEIDWPAARQFLANSYEVAPETLDRDFADFAGLCHRDGLLAPEGRAAVPGPAGQAASPPPSPGNPVADTFRAIGVFYRTRHGLARAGFRTTYERYARLPIGSDLARLPAALRAFGRAEHFFVAGRAPNDCLVRSLSLFRFLREQGVPAEHVIGVRRLPFQAHAWVECGGEPLRDERSGGGVFVPLARLGGKASDSGR